jgi:1,2-phenylacetyl-CoA epoxidase catalytic subunit
LASFAVHGSAAQKNGNKEPRNRWQKECVDKQTETGLHVPELQGTDRKWEQTYRRHSIQALGVAALNKYRHVAEWQEYRSGR